MREQNDAAGAFVASSYAYSLTHSASACIDHLAALGFRHIELVATPGHLWPDELDAAARRALVAQCAALGVRISTLVMPSMDINLTAASPDVRRHTIDAIAALIALAGDIGAGNVLITPGKSNPLLRPPAERLSEHFYHALDRLVPLARGADVRIVVENVPACFPADAAGLADLLDVYGAHDVAIAYDVANAHFIGEDLGFGLAVVKHRLAVLHLSDTTGAAWRHDEIGAGSVPFAQLPALLREIGFFDRPVLEIISPDQDGPLLRSAAALTALGWPIAADAEAPGAALPG